MCQPTRLAPATRLGERAAARRALVAFARVRDLGDDVRREVAADVHVAEMEALAVRARDEVVRPRDELVDDDDRPLRADRRGVARDHPRGGDLIGTCGPELAGRHCVCELRLVDLVVAADDRGDEPLVLVDEEGRLRGLVRADAEECREIGDRRCVRRRDLFDRQGVANRRLGLADRRHLPVRREAARLAEDEDVLAGGIEDHELVGKRAAHHAHVRRDRDGAHPEPLEDPHVGAVLCPVADVQPILIAVRRVRVLHDELADPDQAVARTRLVAPLRLEVVDLERELPVRADDVAEQVGNDLLVRHRKDHVAARAVLEAAHLDADLVVAPGLAPDVRRVDDRHEHLLAADRVHLLADDLLDALLHPESERQEGVDPGSELPDVAGAEKEAMRGHLGVGRILAKGLEEEGAQTHGAKCSGPHRSTTGPGSRPLILSAS